MKNKIETIVGLLLIAFIGFVIFTVVHILYTAFKGVQTEEPTPVAENLNEDEMIAAYVVSQQIIEEYLTSPGTAKYPVNPTAYIKMSEGVYKVQSYVDSQNALGGTIRTEYQTQFTFDGTSFAPQYVAADGVIIAGTLE